MILHMIYIYCKKQSSAPERHECVKINDAWISLNLYVFKVSGGRRRNIGELTTEQPSFSVATVVEKSQGMLV